MRPIGCSSSSSCQLTCSQLSNTPTTKHRRATRMQASRDQPFNTESYDRQRLILDAQARDSMISKAAAETAVEAAAPGSKEGAWKWAIRKKMWDYMEENDIARFPRPVHHRIPNFVDAEKAAARLAQLPEFKAGKIIKVNPDTPQKMVRYEVLSSCKTLLTPQPRLRTGFFSTLTLEDFPKDALMEACTSAGVAKYGHPVGLSQDELKVDMIVVGSSAVSRNGARLGKGEGFAELEYGILRWMGAIDDSTPVVTTIHDCQLLEDDIDPDKMLEHDVPVDIIVTPTQVIRTNSTLPKPSGILWHKLSPQKLGQIRVLRELKERIEQESNQKLPTGPDEVLPPLAERKNINRKSRNSGGRGRGSRGRGAHATAQGRVRDSSSSSQQQTPVPSAAARSGMAAQ